MTRARKNADPAATADPGEAGSDLIAGRVPDDADPTPEQMLDEFFGEEHSDVNCSVYELTGPRHDQRGFLFRFPFVRGAEAAELFERLLENYGPGWYELQGTLKSGGWVKRQVFQVGSERDRARAAFPPRRDENRNDQMLNGHAAPSRGTDPELKALLEQNTRALERLIDRQTEPRDTLTFARELAEIKNLFAPPEPKETPFGEMMKLVKDFMELKSELGDGGDNDSPLVAALRQFGPAINKAVDRLSENGSAAASPQTAARAAIVDPDAGTARPGGSANGNGGAATLMDLNALFADLYARAQAKQKPADVADAVLVYLADSPEWVEAAVLSMVVDERERVAGRLVGSYPPLEAHRDWLGEVIAELLKLIEPDDDTGAGGDETQQTPKPAVESEKPAALNAGGS